MRYSTYVGLFLLMANPAIADECLRNQREVLSASPGSGGNHLVKFAFESRRERFNRTSFNYVWCIEADRENLNIAEFKWGDDKDPCKYLCTWIEPGHGAPSQKLDGSNMVQHDRAIKYSRKNRDEWNFINAPTISSKRLGAAKPSSPGVSVIPIQLRSNELTNDDGIIQIDRLSDNFDDFVQLLKEEKEFRSGGDLALSLPANSSVAKSLATDSYEKYSPNDFVRATAVLQSVISYSKGNPTLAYLGGVFAAKDTNYTVFASLIGQITMKIAPAVESSLPFPTVKPIVLEGGPQLFGGDSLAGPITYASAKIEIAVDNFVVGTFEAPIFVPRK
jgi:hypothetical protein